MMEAQKAAKDSGFPPGTGNVYPRVNPCEILTRTPQDPWRRCLACEEGLRKWRSEERTVGRSPRSGVVSFATKMVI